METGDFYGSTSKALKHVLPNLFLYLQMYSTYFLQWEMLSVTVGIILISYSTIKIPARTGPKGETIATLSFSWYMSPSKQKSTYLVHIFFFVFLKSLYRMVVSVYIYIYLQNIQKLLLFKRVLDKFIFKMNFFSLQSFRFTK